jgi:hypothetical protein
MSKDLESKSKKELVAIIEQFQSKLSEMQGVEAKQEASETGLDGYSFSIFRTLENDYKLAKIAFDAATKAAKVVEIEDLGTKDYALAAHRAKMELFDKVLNMKNIDHLKEKTNG